VARVVVTASADADSGATISDLAATMREVRFACGAEVSPCVRATARP